MEEALQLAIAGIPIAVNVFLSVQGLKVFGVERGTPGQWAIVFGFFFGLGALAASLFPDVAQYIYTVNVYIVGSLSAGLFYEYLAKPVLGQIGIDLSS